jgi:cytochrome c peroxidase
VAVASTHASVVLKPLLPPPLETPDVVPLSPGEKLGKAIFFDHTLSNPQGYSCATCHIPQAGFTGPRSLVNVEAGPVPGIVPGRTGRRRPQMISYTMFSPAGPYLAGAEGGTYLGGNFWDGRAPDLMGQARMPFLDQNEMANTPVGPYPPHTGGYSPLVAQKLQRRPYTSLFKKVFGGNVFQTSTDEDIYGLMTQAIAMYEASAEVNPFSSKYDASTNGVPLQHRYKFTPSEENGRQLFFGKAQCFQCHSDATLAPVLQAAQGKETFTMYCYANIGVPANPGNPFYSQTNCDSDPEGCNPLGPNYVDYGLGANPNPAPDGTLFMNAEPGDIEQFRGLFKAPSLRNVDKRPNPGFVKSYMHNGVFKSLEQVVHFYNKRNIATNAEGDEVSFTLGYPLPEGYTPIFAPPEVLDNVQNASGITPAESAGLAAPPSDDTDAGPVPVNLNGQIGNLQLTAKEEKDLVDFLKTLTDGYTRPNPVTDAPALAPRATRPIERKLGLQLTGKPGHSYLMQTSTDLVNWVTVSTNVLTSPILDITNTMGAGAGQRFWRAVRVR